MTDALQIRSEMKKIGTLLTSNGTARQIGSSDMAKRRVQMISGGGLVLSSEDSSDDLPVREQAMTMSLVMFHSLGLSLLCTCR